MNHKKYAALIILDGLGYAQDSKCNAPHKLTCQPLICSLTRIQLHF